MKELNIQTNIEEFKLNGTVSVFYNPSDPNFIGEIFDALNDFSNKTDEYHSQIEKASVEEALALGRKLDADMRARFEQIFGVDVITPIIGKTNVYAVADGLPIWANLLLAVMETLKGVDEEQLKRGNSRIAAYTKKYTVSDHKKKQGKSKTS